jgi:hypothetical protein
MTRKSTWRPPQLVPTLPLLGRIWNLDAVARRVASWTSYWLMHNDSFPGNGYPGFRLFISRMLRLNLVEARRVYGVPLGTISSLFSPPHTSYVYWLVPTHNKTCLLNEEEAIGNWISHIGYFPPDSPLRCAAVTLSRSRRVENRQLGSLDPTLAQTSTHFPISCFVHQLVPLLKERADD